MWTVPDPWSNSYLLGMYLGDGWVGPPSRPNRLCFTLDEAYPEIISETIVAIQLAAFFNPVTTRRHRSDAGIVVNCCANHWGDAFPQHGPGRKHSRLGVGWTQSNHRDISVPHRRSVAILDGFIGPKS